MDGLSTLTSGVNLAQMMLCRGHLIVSPRDDGRGSNANEAIFLIRVNIRLSNNKNLLYSGKGLPG